MATVLKLNLGCGRRVLPGWINIDIHPLIPFSKIPGLTWFLFKLRLIPESAYKMKWPPGTMWHDIRKGLPFKDNTVDFIYASHFFEHVREQEAEKILLECYRVLKSKGLVRIVVPDLEFLAKKYVKGDTDFFAKLKPGRDLTGAFLDTLAFYPTKLSRRVLPGQYHYWMYDFKSLSRMLKKCRFKNVRKKMLKKSKIPEISAFEVAVEYNLYVEAQK